MAIEVPGFQLPGVVCGATSLATKQYHFVKLHTDGTAVVCSAITDKPIGVLQNKPAPGEPAEIMMTGLTKLVGDANLALDDIIGTSVDGQAALAVATMYVAGRVFRENTAAGGYVSALINLLAPSKFA